MSPEMKALFENIAKNSVQVASEKKESTKVVHPFRVEHEGVFFQPTKGYSITGTGKNAKRTYSKDAKDYKWSYVYIGFRVGDKVTGFSMATKFVLELVANGTLSLKTGKAFEAFTEAHPNLVQFNVQIINRGAYCERLFITA